MAPELIVIGGGEHARVVIEAARARPEEWAVVGFLDPLPCEATVQLGVARLGDDSDAARVIGPNHWLVLGVGAVGVSSIRQKVVARYSDSRWATVVHERAWVSPTATLAPGAAVMAGAIINAGAKIGAHCVINTGAIVEHDCQLGAFSQLGPGAIIGGGVVIGDGSYLGLGCRVRDHLNIGADVLVGMGAVVTSSVAAGQTVKGIPARHG